MPKRTAHIFEDKWRSDDVKLQESADFSSLLLSEKVLLGLKKAGFKTPSPIQLEAIPVGRVGSHLLVQAKSGTGKTLVFTIIALDLLMDQKQPQVLILAPTREIAFQICDVVRSVGCAFHNLKCGAFIGGIPIETDLQNIQGCQIVVGTPGRIKQLISLNILKLMAVRLLVFDEADQLLDKSFKPEIDSIVVSVPSDVQVIATSATYPKALQKLLSKIFKHDPYVARLNVNDLSLLGIMHYARNVEVSPMPVLANKMKMQALEDVLTNVTFSQCLVFCNSISKVEPICDDIKLWGFSATYITSAKEQAARLKAIECLKRFKCKVLVTSDITSRGIDAENVDLIISIDVPYTTEVYLHRVGRAGRFGSKGVAITFVAPNEMPSFKKIQKNGNFKSYVLPDPVPANLINLKPSPKLESIEVEDSTSESSEEESISPDIIPHDSSIKMHKFEHASNETGEDAASIENHVLHLNTLNSSSPKENDAFADNQSEIGSRTADFCKLKDSCEDELADKSLEKFSEHTKEVSMNGEDLKNHLDNLNYLNESNENTFEDKDNQYFSRLINLRRSKNYCKDESAKKLLETSYERKKEELVNKLFDELNGIYNTHNSLEISNENIFEGKENKIDSQLVDFCMSENSCEGESAKKLSEKSSVGRNYAREIVDEYLSMMDNLNTTNSSDESTLKDNVGQIGSQLASSCTSDNTSNDESLTKLPASKIDLLQIPANDSIGYHSSSSEPPDKSKNDEVSADRQGNLTIDVCVKEVSNEIFIKNGNEVEVCSLNLEDKATDASDLGGRALTDAPSVDIGGEQCKLNLNAKLKSDIYSEVLEQNSIDNGKCKTVEASCSPVASNVVVSPIQVDEVTVSVMKFLDEYEKKKAAVLNGDAEKPIQATSTEAKWLIDELTLSRKSLNDYYYEVFQAYRNGNITGDPSEILELIKKQNGVSPVEENDAVVETKEDDMPSAYKTDLSSWSRKLGNVNVNGVQSDLTEESADSSLEYILQSTPVKAKNTQLDVSSDTPSFLNLIDDPETDDSSNSNYSDKCLQLENAVKNKIGTVNKSPKHSSDTSSSSDAESSLSSDGSAELTLLERACKGMAKTNSKNMTLAEKADMLRRELLDLESKVHSMKNSYKESLSDIQISTAAHSSKGLGNDRALNDKCGSRPLLQSKTKESDTKSLSSLSSFSSIRNPLVAKRSTRGRRSSIRSCSSGNSVNTSQGKYRQFSLSGETSSTESSVSLSSQSTCSEKRRGSKRHIHSRAKKVPIQCSHAEGYAAADQSNCHSTYPQNPSNSYFNPQGGFERSGHPTHEHSDSCYWPSQHQCHSLNGHSGCQSQACADWYNLFYSQWYFIQHSSHFQ